MLALDGSVYVVPVAGSTETGAGTTFCIEATAALAGCPAAVIHTRPALTATSRATAGYPSRKRRGRGTGTRMMPSVGRHEQDQLTLLIDRLMSSSCPDRDSITVIVGAAVPGLLPHLQVVDVRPAVGGGGGGSDGVGARVERGRDPLDRPVGPYSGARERHSRGDDRAVDADIHRPVGGRAVAVAQFQRRRAGRGGVDRPLHVAAGQVGVVDEPGTAVAGMGGLDRPLRDRRALRLVPVRQHGVDVGDPGAVDPYVGEAQIVDEVEDVAGVDDVAEVAVAHDEPADVTVAQPADVEGLAPRVGAGRVGDGERAEPRYEAAGLAVVRARHERDAPVQDAAEAVEVDVFGEAAPQGVRLDVEGELGHAHQRAVVGVDVADTAGQFAAAGDRAPVAVHPAAEHHDVLARDVDPPAVGVAAGLDRDVVVVRPEVTVLDHDVVAALRVAPVGVGVSGTGIGADAVDG